MKSATKTGGRVVAIGWKERHMIVGGTVAFKQELDSDPAALSNQRYSEVANWTESGEPASKPDDMGFAFDLESLEPGIHTISIRLVEDGGLWHNEWYREYTLNVQVQ